MVYCCVPYCKSTGGRDRDVSFHEFPCDDHLRKEWLKAISRKDFVVNSNSASSVVCSKHFKPEDYVSDCRRRNLKKGSVPSVIHYHPSYKMSVNRRLVKQFSCQSTKNCGQKRKNEGVSPTCKKVRVGILESVAKEHSYGANQSALKNEAAERSSVSVTLDEVKLLLQFSNSENVIHSHQMIQSSDATEHPTSSLVTEHSPVISDHPTLSAATGETQSLFPSSEGENLRKEQRKTCLLMSSLWKKNMQLQQQKQQILELQKKITYYEQNKYHSSLEKIIAMDEIENNCTSFVLEQVENFLKKKPVWNERTIRDCVLWNALSPKAYDLIREQNMLKLPCRKTLARYIETAPVKEEPDV